MAHSAAALGILQRSVAASGYPIYFSTQAVRIDGLDFDPAAGDPLVMVPSADGVGRTRVHLHDFPLVEMPALILHLPDLGGSMEN